jgi:phospholipase/carboxylesterase
MKSHVRRLTIAFSWLFLGCSNSPTEDTRTGGVERLSARPASNVTSNAAPGTYVLGIATANDTRLIIPSSATATASLPLMIMLHGAGGDEAPLEPVIAAAEQYGVAIIIPRSRGSSWDVARGGFGDDVRLIDRALEKTFERIRADRSHIAFAGFSDGASYALSLGLANGDLATHVVAFAPGFMTPVPRFGRPQFYIVHGTNDVVTSARNTEDNFVPFLRALGYDVTFRSFAGGHQVLPPEVDSAFRWFLGR